MSTGTRLTVALAAMWITCGCNDPELFDFDGDGSVDADDCAAEDPEIHPGAGEDCGDGVDNNCDGLVDGADPECADVDGDGYDNDADCAPEDPDI